jgi:predicted MFS family arabinose efflux permease
VSSGGADLRRGWLITGALSITVTIAYGVLTYAFGVLLPAMEDDLGWSRAAITGAFSLALLVSALTGLAVGPVLDRRSPRLLMTAGAAAAALFVVAWSRVETVTELYLVFAGLGLTMATLLYEPVFTVVTKWFVTQQHSALTAVTLVGATASLIFLPLTERLEAAYGWRQALLVLAVILAAIAVPLHALVLRPSPDVDVREELMHPPRRVVHVGAFWFLAGAFTLASFSTYAIVVHLVSLLIEGGRSPAFAALVAGLLGIAQLPGRLIFGLVGRRLGTAAQPAAVFGLGAAALVLLAAERSAWAAIVFAVTFGASNGMATLLRGTLVADLWGRRNYGAISAMIAAPFNLARAAAPVGASLLVLLPGAYTTLLWILAAATTIAAVAGTRAERVRPLIAESTPPLPPAP